ncbi:regulatory LuxR family protein [Tamaricihabitans halophyticus]|uniref:Regulatory LuxR family protein n=1 Tax=Tamaricihabitans halophyticus TaxID=1262583 RepID=A0A4V2SS17_9PSEU|nr:LuxR family transcriptional regulator [Tamaricihabitans halophyticus]TCP45026.1 regulatory LuxR family protein [Tamaricihabitans halophyticus]
MPAHPPAALRASSDSDRAATFDADPAGAEVMKVTSAVSPGRGDSAVPAASKAGKFIVLDDSQRAVVDDVLLTVRGGGSRALVIAGAPGTGRSTTLHAAADTGRRLGITVAHVRAESSEQRLGLAVVGRLFDVLRGALPAGWRPDDWHRPAGLDRLAILCSALTSAARRNPLALLIDDVHWADPASDMLLRMLLRRLRHAPLALVVTSTGAWPASSLSSLDKDDTPPAEDVLLRLGPLNAAQVSEACQRICGKAADAAFSTGVLDVTAGNPRVLTDTLTDFARGGGQPTGAQGEAFADLAAEHRGRQVVALLDRLPRGMIEVLRLLAVADGDVEFDRLTNLVSTGCHAAGALAELRAYGLVAETEPVRPADAVVRDRVLAGLSVPARRALHAAVAEVAHRIAARDEVVARILLGAYRPPGPWAIGVLRRAAASALDAGRREEAAAFLEFVLSAHLTVDQHAELQLEFAAAVVVDRPAASDRALAQVGGVPGGALSTRLRAVDLLLARGAATVARRVANARLASLGPAEAQTPTGGALVNGDQQESTSAGWVDADNVERRALIALRVLAEEVLQAPAAGARLPSERSVPADHDLGDIADPVVAGVAGCALAFQGKHRERAGALASAALVPAFEQQPLGTPRLAAATALLLTEDFAAAEAGLRELYAQARSRGQRSTAAGACLGLASRSLLFGLLDEATERLAEARTTLPPDAWHPTVRPMMTAQSALVDVMRGELDSAGRIIAELETSSTCSADEDGFAWTYLRYARAALALATDNPSAAERDLRECGRRLTACGWRNPLLIRWRPLLASALHGIGAAEEEIRSLLEADRSVAAAWGTASAIGSAELSAGLVLDSLGDPTAGELLVTAERTLRGTPLRLRRAEALAALGARNLRAGRAHADGNEDSALLLAEARRLADEVGAVQLRDQADADLSALIRGRGQVRARSRCRPVPARWAKLSEAEGRVVELAVSGQTNPEIASALAVTRRTVEMHLSRAYRKLGIASRDQLAGLVPAGAKG